MAEYTKAEKQSISEAFRAINYLCGCTNWSDEGTLKAALKLERIQMESIDGARAMVCKAWLEGTENPDKPASKFYFIREGYLKAFLLGVSHALERQYDNYTGPMVTSARELCPAAVEALEANTQRIVEEV